MAAPAFVDPDVLMKEIIARSPQPSVWDAMEELHPIMVKAMAAASRAALRVEDVDFDDASSARGFFNEIYTKCLIESPAQKYQRESRAAAARKSGDAVEKFFGESLTDKLPSWQAEAARSIIAATGAGEKLLARTFRFKSGATSAQELEIPDGLLPLSATAAANYYKVCSLAGDNDEQMRARILAFVDAVCVEVLRVFSEGAAAKTGEAPAVMRGEFAKVAELVKAGGLDYSRAEAALKEGKDWASWPYGDAYFVAALDGEMRAHLESKLFAPLLAVFDKACESA